jgi:2-polyprenyl-6-hydroxyphenyl methylase/3-demethylubiquinone-9 3-methyltransferase
MPVDNALYDRLADSWWDEAGLLHVLKALAPPRFAYLRRIIVETLGRNLRDLTVLDVGCGGGVLAEEFAAQGSAVTGIDPSVRSLEAAREHARAEGLAITYRQGTGEALPFTDATFDLAYCCDVLEHVSDVSRVITEAARVIRPGGAFLFDTINRTMLSRLVIIKLLQEWRWSSFMPANLHDWNRFIRPSEMRGHLRSAGLVAADFVGLKPRASPIRVIKALHARKRGRLTYADAVRAMDLGVSGDLSIMYLGYARKP